VVVGKISVLSEGELFIKNIQLWDYPESGYCLSWGLSFAGTFREDFLAKHRQIKNLFYTYRILYARLADVRTDLTHEYFSVDIELLWFTAKDILQS